MSRPGPESPRFKDPLDVELGTRPIPRRSGAIPAFLRRHAALGLAPVIAPAVVFVPLGVIAGPQGLRILNQSVLGYLDPVVSVALAALGIFAGLAIDDILRRPRLVAASAVEAGVTLLVVTLVLAYLVAAWRLPMALPVLVVALCLGLGASPSSAPALGAEHPAARVADLDDLVPIAGVAILLAALYPGRPALLLLAVTVVIGLAVGIVTDLLLGDHRGPSERVVIAVGALLLLGGAAAYASVSPLAAGFVAGAFWRRGGRRRRVGETILGDIQKLHHPLVVLLLIVAGASSVFTVEVLWLSAALGLSRLLGKLAGGFLGSRIAGGLAPADLGLLLLPPGVFGIAVLLNAQHVLGVAAMAPALTATVLASVLFEVVGLAAAHEEPQ
ncbi:MAG TPA: hypothetical protein VK911_12350 [Vicinamibacterales bacterium]|nr:hypothetical protein [Vicinamibacterales bacterium]